MKHNLIYHAHITMHKHVLAGNDHAKYNTQLEALARDGINLRCDRDTLASLLPNTSSIAPRQPKQLEVNFVLPHNDYIVQCQCEVYSLRRISKDCFQLDMKFHNLSAEQDQALDSYIEAQLHNPEQLKQDQQTKQQASMKPTIKIDRTQVKWNDLSKFLKRENEQVQAA